MSIQHISLNTRRELEKLVFDKMDTIEEELKVIGNKISIDSTNTLDALCVDQNERLVVLKLSVTEDDKTLFEGLRCLEYVDKFKFMLKATYEKSKINEKEKPRLIIIAPSYSKELLSLFEHISEVPIDLLRWEYLKLGDNESFFIEPVYASQFKPKPRKKSRAKKTKKKETKKATEPAEEEETTSMKETVKKTPQPQEKVETEKKQETATEKSKKKRGWF
ncbi:MAG: hypothetical protein U9O89_05785 [Thermoproteota archaeon]|nr:hypothetical protein [Thermoproteota archaeon]